MQHSAARCGRRCAVAVHSRLPGNPPAPPTLDVTDEADWGRRGSDRDEAIDREASRPGPAEPAMDRDSAPAENRRPPWTDMELAGAGERKERRCERGVDEPASAGGCCCEAESPRGHSPTIVPSSRSSSPATTSQPLSAPPPTSCRGRPRFPSRRDCAWTRCAASASPSVKTPPCVPSDSAGRLHQCEPSLNCSVRSAAPAVGCSGGTNSIHDFMRRCRRRGRCPHRLPERQRPKLRPRTSVLANVG